MNEVVLDFPNKQQLCDEIDRLAEQVAILKEALEFYAVPANYAYSKLDNLNYIWNDQGNRAIEALSKVEGMK